MDYEQAKAQAQEIINKSLDHEVWKVDPSLARKLLIGDVTGAVIQAYHQGIAETLTEWREYDKQHMPVRKEDRMDEILPIHDHTLTEEIAEEIAEYYGRPAIDAEYKLAEQIIGRVFKHAAELKARRTS